MAKAIKVRQIEVIVTTLSPLHIGGRDDVFADVHGRVARAGDHLVIPGPSFKGACRYSVEKILISQYASQSEMKPCIPAPKKEVSDDEKRLDNLYRTNGGCTYDRNPFICPACYLFGAQSLAGMVYMPFLTSDCRPQDLYSLRLDRALGVGAGGNREYEFVPEGKTFTGTVEALLQDDFRRWELGKPRPLAKKKDGIQADAWLASNPWSPEDIINSLLLPAMQGIDQMGGFRSKGFGKVKVEARLGEIVERGPKAVVGGRQLKVLTNFHLARYDFTIRLEEPAHLPPYKGSTIRGGLAWGVKQVSCTLHHSTCQNCPAGSGCAYAYVFETN